MNHHLELYIGGYAQGKTEYVQALYPEAEMVQRYDGRNTADILVWNKFHLAVKELLAEGKSKEEILELVWQANKQCKKLVIISDEIGNGIVPMEKDERLWREETGRILCSIAGQADKVERIICKLPQRIK